MDKQTALEILIANACCSSLELSCLECPLYTPDQKQNGGLHCRDYGDADMVEAVRIMKGGVD